jgi:hypothetical protein
VVNACGCDEQAAGKDAAAAQPHHLKISLIQIGIFIVAPSSTFREAEA